MMVHPNVTYLQREIKSFINYLQSLIDKAQIGEEFINNKEYSQFAERIWNVHYFSKELLGKKNLEETAYYNATIVKDLLEIPLHVNKKNRDFCSLIGAADRLKYDDNLETMKTMLHNFLKDKPSLEGLFDDLTVIYKDLAA